MKEWNFFIDRGGTFTDCIAWSEQGELRRTKVLSSDWAPVEGMKKLLGMSIDTPLPKSIVKMGTTIATNALLERKGHPFVLLTTKGFKDLLEIGTQQRPELFQLNIQKPTSLYADVSEVKERCNAEGEIEIELDVEECKSVLQHYFNQGYRDLAILFLFSHVNPEHELQVAQLARAIGFEYITCSHQSVPEMGAVGRGDTTCADAYLTPLIKKYTSLLSQEISKESWWMMQSNGCLIHTDRFKGHHALLSGPAAGVVACASLSKISGESHLIGFDMGGTSTDVCRFDGQYEESYEATLSGVRVRVPMLKIHTIASGGGSFCQWRSGRMTVGPESAGSKPGPVAYGLKNDKGHALAETLAVTDMNVALGRVLPDFFPFELDREAVQERLEVLRLEVQKDGFSLSKESIAEGFLEVVNLQMAQAVKDISVARGYDVQEYTLCSYGGAGGQHACAIARLLGMKKIISHPLAGVFSAWGMGLARAGVEKSSPGFQALLNKDILEDWDRAFSQLKEQALIEMKAQGIEEQSCEVLEKVDLRYVGSEVPLTVDAKSLEAALSEFEKMHRQYFGYLHENRPVEVVQYRLTLFGPEQEVGLSRQEIKSTHVESERKVPLFSSGEWKEVPVFLRQDLFPGAKFIGPALILEDCGTVFVEEEFEAEIDANDCLILRDIRKEEGQYLFSEELNPVRLEIFNHLFMSVADQMGQILRLTSVSTNIRERLDFSCALFDDGGRLIANAPHQPVHLGAMGETVRAIIEEYNDIENGDVFVSNHPGFGGSHLPDITVIHPVFISSKDPKPSFYTANRAHHAEIGGIVPGSMPAHSSRLEEEGVVIDRVRLVSRGVFDEKLFASLFEEHRYPSRSPKDNRSDLEAQIASCQRGATQIMDMCHHYGEQTVKSYMKYIRENAAREVREALKKIPNGIYQLRDEMDQGSIIQVEVKVEEDQAWVDFSGTSEACSENLNAPRAVARAAALYVFRCLVDSDIPLNEGCLDPIQLTIPEGCLLNPPYGSAVAGGNVETSQRIVDVLLGALSVSAASQGTMNNLCFGDESSGYYETICGGAGATPAKEGASAVHTHMTNTRITDPEVLESRFPVTLREFSIREGSGGEGQNRGGDGVIRKIQFNRNMKVSMLSSRRTTQPFGLKGGESGQPGSQVVIRQGEGKECPSAFTLELKNGDVLEIQTPGGGGYGEKE